MGYINVLTYDLFSSAQFGDLKEYMKPLHEMNKKTCRKFETRSL